MLLLITIGLVLVAAITLLIGIFSNSLPLIYVSIGSSFLAAIVLVVLSQISRRGREVAPVPAAEPIPEPQREAERVPAGVGAVASGGATPQPARPSRRTFPIAEYDDLTVAEILPRLESLNAEDLDTIAEREETSKNRSTILSRIDELLDQLEEESIEAEEEVEDAGLQAAGVAAGTAEEDFPIDNYDGLAVSAILPLLDDLDAEELDIVAEREETGKNRVSVLNRIDERLDELEGVAPAPTPPAKKAAKKKAAVKKAPAPAKKKAAAKKAPAPVRKKAAKKAPALVRKKAAKKAPAPAKKKAAAKKAPAPAKKKAAAAKKKAAAKKRA